MVDVWIYRISGSENVTALNEILSEEERRRMNQFVFERNRREFLCAHALVRLALSQYRDVAPRDWDFGTGTWGKPFVTNESGCQFNLSHTIGLVACAVTQTCEVGVDVEKIDRQVAAAEIAQRFFSEPEARYIESLHEELRRDAFFRIWTLKEAYIKVCGRGFSLPLGEFGFDLRNDGVRVWPSSNWEFSEFQVEEEYQMAVATMGPGAGAAVLRDGGALLYA